MGQRRHIWHGSSSSPALHPLAGGPAGGVGMSISMGVGVGRMGSSPRPGPGQEQQQPQQLPGGPTGSLGILARATAAAKAVGGGGLEDQVHR